MLEHFLVFGLSMAILEAEHRDSMFFLTVSLLLSSLVVNVVLLIAKRYGSLNTEYGICTCIYYITHISTVFAPTCLCIKIKIGYNHNVP